MFRFYFLQKNPSIFIICVIFFCGTNATRLSAQSSQYKKNYNDSSYNDYNLKKRPAAKIEIENLKNGALLFMLQSRSITFKTMRDSGYGKEADLMQEQQTTFNKNLIKAVRKAYNFSALYFLSSHDAPQLRNDSFAIIFLNDDALPDSSIVLKEKTFLIGEFGTITQQSFGFVEGDKKESTYEMGTGIKENCFIIRNRFMHLIKSPFPSYYSCFNKKYLERKMRFYNEKLILFYAKTHQH